MELCEALKAGHVDDLYGIREDVAGFVVCLCVTCTILAKCLASNGWHATLKYSVKYMKNWIVLDVDILFI